MIPECLILVDHPHLISVPFVRYGSGVAIATSSPRHLQHPAWLNNLLANPQSTVILNGHEVAVRARLASTGEAHGLLPKLIEVWPPLATYLKRVHEQCVRLFILEPI